MTPYEPPLTPPQSIKGPLTKTDIKLKRLYSLPWFLVFISLLILIAAIGLITLYAD